MYCGVPEEDPDKLVALVLAGGMSSRMGKDKGLLERDGLPWVIHTSKLCASVNLSVFHSISISQSEQYQSILSVDTIIIDAVDVKGPLAGLLSFYIQYPDTDVLLLPCDMVRLEKSVLDELIHAYETLSVGHDIIVFQHEDGAVEPMPGVYTKEALKKLYWLYAAGELKKHSLKYCIEISNSEFILINPEQNNLFVNANTPEDLI